MTKTGKKGATLAELCVVLALIAVVSGMVVSFVMLFSARTNESSARLRVMEELELVENATEGWMSRAGSLTINEAGVLVDGGGNTISFDSARKILTAGDISVKLEQVSDIKFAFLNNAGDVLCVCKVTDSAGITHTICINPHVGDVHKEAGSAEGQEGEQG